MPPKDIIISIWNYACPTKPISFSITHKPNNFCDSVTSNSFFFSSKIWSQKEFLLGLNSWLSQSGFLNIFNNKVIFQRFHYFLFEKKNLVEKFFSIIK